MSKVMKTKTSKPALLLAPLIAARMVVPLIPDSHPPESNRRPTDYESVALPTELGWQILEQLCRQTRLLLEVNRRCFSPAVASAKAEENRGSSLA